MRIRSGMLAHEALEALRADGSNAEARATFERHRADLGYGLLLTPYAKEIGKADEGAIAKAVDDSIPQVAPLFWSFRLMVGIGVVLLLLFGAAFLQLCRGRLVQSTASAQGPVLEHSAALDCHRGGLVRGRVRPPALDHQRRAAGVGVGLPAATGSTLVQPDRHLPHLQHVAGGGAVLVASCDPQRARQPADGSLSR